MKKINKKLLSIVFVFIFTIIAGSLASFIPQTAHAIGIDDKTLSAYDFMKQWSQSTNGGGGTDCSMKMFDRGTNSQSGFARKIRQGDLDNNSFYGYFWSKNSEDSNFFRVGLTGEHEAGGNSDGDGIIQCVTGYKFVMSTLYGSGRKTILGKLYDLSSKDSNDEYSARKSDINSDIITPAIENWMSDLEKRSDFKDSFTIYENTVVLSAFKNCWTPKSNLAKGYDKYTSDNYNRLKSGRANTGWATEVAVDGSYSDGRVDCDNIFNYVKENKLLDKDASKGAADSLRADAVRDVIKNLDNYRDILKVCLANQPSLVNLSTAKILDTVSEWLASKSTSGFSYKDDSGKTVTVDATEAKNIRNCLKSNIPGLADTLKESIDSTPTAGSGSSSSGSIGDCDFNNIVPSGWSKVNPLAWAKEFAQSAIDWFGCQVIKGVLNFVEKLNDSIDGYLRTDKDQFSTDATKAAWNRFLTIANIIFVIGFLIMLLSTALGLGVVDAYTVKKFLPRIILAIILANLSFAIIQVSIQLTNALGGAVESFILGPVSKSNLLTQVANSNVRGLVGVGVGAAAGYAVVGLATGGIFALGPAAAILLVAVFTAWAVITIRRVIILLLIVVAPLGIALWALPGVESWAKRWWKLFIEMLLVYPIVKALIAAGMFTASIVYNNADAKNGDVNTGEALTVLGAIILPYLLMPAVFKLASSTLGNITGMVNNRSKGLIDRSKKLSAEKRKQGWERKYAPRVLARRSDMAGRLMARASGAGTGRSVLMRAAARGVGGYNIEAAMSARNAQEKKIIDDQIATGRDDEIRGLSVNKKAVDKMGWANAKAAGLVREDNGRRQYKTLGGAWVDESAVIEGHRRWGNNQFAQQASLSYEMRKAMEDGQVQDITDRYASLAKDQWGNTDRQASGTWIGAAFENQNQHIEFKNTSWAAKNADGSLRRDASGLVVGGGLDGNKFATEVYEKKGSYPLAQMSGHTITQLGNAFDQADMAYGQAQLIANDASASDEARQKAIADMATHQDTMDKISAISETFVQRGASMANRQMSDDPAMMMPPPLADNATPEQIAAHNAQVQYAQTYGSGPAAVNEKINWLARKTNRKNPNPTPQNLGPHAPPPGPGAEQNAL